MGCEMKFEVDSLNIKSFKYTCPLITKKIHLKLLSVNITPYIRI